MSVHLKSQPLNLGTLILMSAAVPLDHYDDGNGISVKVTTKITDKKIMTDILANSLLGFKSKRELNNFQNRCSSIFYTKNGVEEIVFIGNFKKTEIKNYVSTLNKEFLKRVNPSINPVNTNKFTNTIDKKNINNNKIEENENNINNDENQIKIEEIEKPKKNI